MFIHASCVVRVCGGSGGGGQWAVMAMAVAVVVVVVEAVAVAWAVAAQLEPASLRIPALISGSCAHRHVSEPHGHSCPCARSNTPMCPH